VGLLHVRLLADPLFIIVDHDEVIRAAEQHHESGDSSIYSSALGFLDKNKVIIH
jgi:hypothetical protein